MTINPLNDISRVYLQNIAESSHLETDMKKRQTENEKALKDMKKTPAYKSMASAAAKKFDEAVDQDEDGDNDFADVRIARMIASGVPKEVAINKTKNKSYNKKSGGVKEGFSNWRQELSEVMTDTEKEEKITEKKVNNKVKTSAMGSGIQIPEAVENLGGTLLEMVEIDDEFVYETIDIATEYFYEQGLNEYGVDILIEELGVSEFVEFVFEISDDYVLSEARTLVGKKKSPATGKERGVSLKAAPGKSTKSAVEKYGTTRSLSSGSSSGTIKKKSVTVKKAVEKQPETKSTSTKTKTGIAGRIGAALGHAVARAKSDTALLKKSVDTARGVAARRGAEAKAVYDAVRERGKAAEQSPAATRARRKATVAAGRAAQAAAPVVKKAVKAGAAAAGAGAGSLKAGKSPAAAAGRAAGTFVRKMTKEELELQEKAESEQQQKLFGLALSVKRGQTPRSEASAEVLKIVDSMSEKKIRDFAKTKHGGIPKKVSEAVSDQTPLSPQELQAQRQKSQLDSKIAMLRKQSLSKVKKSDVIGEEESDRANDERLMRGGVGAGRGSSRPASGSSKPYDPKKHAETTKKAVDLVRQSIIAKYGKGSLM
jgi:hypothetical protein